MTNSGLPPVRKESWRDPGPYPGSVEWHAHILDRRLRVLRATVARDLRILALVRWLAGRMR